MSSDLKISMHGTVDVASVWLVGKKNQNYGLKFIIHSKQLLVTCPFSNDYLFYKKKILAEMMIWLTAMRFGFILNEDQNMLGIIRQKWCLFLECYVTNTYPNPNKFEQLLN